MSNVYIASLFEKCTSDVSHTFVNLFVNCFVNLLMFDTDHAVNYIFSLVYTFLIVLLMLEMSKIGSLEIVEGKLVI